MTANKIVANLSEGTILEGPFFAEPVRVLTAKARGARVEIIAEGVNTKQTWKKLLKIEEFESPVSIMSAGGRATLAGNARHFRINTLPNELKGGERGAPDETNEIGLYNEVTNCVRHHFQRLDDEGNCNVGLGLNLATVFSKVL